jgi:DNA invertase Pin-like site-specific DNA recombinase
MSHGLKIKETFMAMVGYARVSSTGQSLDVQVEQLRGAGCEEIFQEKRSGTTREGRRELEAALRFVRKGDVFCVTRLDRLARSMIDLRKIVDTLQEKQVGFRVLQQPIDTTKSEGRLLLNILASFAEFETDIRKERQMDGIAKAKAAGKYRGRKATIDPAQITAMKEKGMGATAIARTLGIGRASVYRVTSSEASNG